MNATRTPEEHIRDLAIGLIEPQRKKRDRAFQDELATTGTSGKQDWEKTKAVEAIVERFAEERVLLVAQSITEAIAAGSYGELAILSVFTMLAPVKSDLVTYAYTEVNGRCPIAGNTGVGRAIDTGYETGIKLGTARLRLLATGDVPAPARGEVAKFSAQRALKELTKQLAALSEAGADFERAHWEHVTRYIIQSFFGADSRIFKIYIEATNAGAGLALHGMTEELARDALALRNGELETCLRSAVDMIRLSLPPEDAIQGVYPPGDQFGFYRDLKALVVVAQREVFIVDTYLNEDIFDLYLAKIPSSVSIRILSAKVGETVEKVGKMFAKGRLLQIRSSSSVHDRAAFIDERGWLIGPSVKDAATKKLAHMTELGEPLITSSRDAHETIWDTAVVLI